MSFVQETQLIAAVVAVACALPGVFLVLRQLALIIDAIGHTVLLGIVAAFLTPFWLKSFLLFLGEPFASWAALLPETPTLRSPVLLLGAALTGVLTVSLVELLHRTGLVREDAAIGLVFSALFSLGVILIAFYGRGGTHLDTDAVLLGELLLAHHKRVTFLGLDLPYALVIMSAILVLNITFIVVFYKELKLATFDAGLAVALGFSPGLLHYGLMTLVSVTAVGAFEAVGSILVVALTIGPPATALLLSNRLSHVLYLSAGLAAAGAVSGCWLGRWLDASLAGAIATTIGAEFLLAFLLAPKRGLIAQALLRFTQKAEFSRTMLVMHLLNHEGRPEAEEESRIDRLPNHLNWPPAFLDRVIRSAERQGLVYRRGPQLALTDEGRVRARLTLSA